MPTILITLKAPIQSWTTMEGYGYRATDDHPSKSAVIGLIASAMGRSRTDDLSDLAELRFAVQTVQPGKHLRDFQTMGKKNPKTANPIQIKTYLTDAKFIAGLEGSLDMIRNIQRALSHPAYPPFLGRRGCPPAGPIQTQVSDHPLEKAFDSSYPMWIESAYGQVRSDQPIENRRFQSRCETVLDSFFNRVRKASVNDETN